MRVVCALLLCVAPAFAATYLEQHSFKNPFQEFDAFGKRVVPYWELSGHAFANKHFVRLTPDRQSKRGLMWNNQPIRTDAWSIVLEFRISGQGRTLFGDGLALWLLRGRNREGQFFGVTENFDGMGIVLDTFKNEELSHVHKDVLLLFNDGTADVTTRLDATLPGCLANYRYHEGRDDFSVSNVSLLKITYAKGRVVVKIDEAGSGSWKTCAITESIPLPDDWFKGAYLGLSASTGQLADNHDVLRMAFYELGPDDEEAPNFAETERTEEPSPPEKASDLPSLIESFTKKHISSVQKEMELMQATLEHQLTAVDDHSKTTIAKLQKQEDESKRRIAELEDRVNRIVDARLQALESALGQKIEAETGSWMMPFLMFAGVVAVAFVLAYRKYRYLIKQHLL